MPPPPGYVGFTGLQPTPTLETCVPAYRNNNHSPSQTSAFTEAAKYATQPAQHPGFVGGFSFFEFSLNLNNYNGVRPLPAGHVYVAEVTTQHTRQQPCNGALVAPPPRKYYEKFKGGNPLDIQFFITGCKSICCFQRTVWYAIVPDPTPAAPVPQGEHASTFVPTPAQVTQFQASRTLKLVFNWFYDGCNNPPNPNNCGKIHCMQFTAGTFDPNQGPNVLTWTQNPVLKYESNP